MAEYVPKLRVPVVVVQAGEPPLRGALSLALHSANRVGPESVFDRLNTPDRLVPFHRAEDDAMLMLSRGALEWVMAGPGVEESRVCPAPIFTTAEERVGLRFQSGGTLEGMLRIELPSHLNRASDFLNGVDDFFPIVTDEGLRLVNKAQILDVVIFESSPLPPSAGTPGHADRL